jgi:excisionase family DNA binding protein
MTQSPLTLHIPDELIEEIARRVLTFIEAGSLDRAVGPGSSSRGWESPYMSVQEAAEYMRAKPQRIYDLLSSGRLTRHKDGRRVLVSLEELKALLNGRPRVAPSLPAPSTTRMNRRLAA